MKLKKNWNENKLVTFMTQDNDKSIMDVIIVKIHLVISKCLYVNKKSTGESKLDLLLYKL